MALTRKQAADLRQNYLDKREELLQKKVDSLAVSLFDKVFNEYLSQLEQSNGNIVNNGKNISKIQGLDQIYKKFNTSENIPVVRNFISDIQGITPLNEVYFKTVSNKPTLEAKKQAVLIINKELGINENGGLIKDGFTDKFIKDTGILKAIKKESLKAITQGKGFQQFKESLKRQIEGESGKPLSGKLQQYYRKYAYDTFQKVDRKNADVFAKNLNLKYFVWAGGKITTSRNLCLACNAKIFDSDQVKKMTFSNLKTEPVNYTDGITSDWVPLDDLGMHNCRHRKDYISNESALKDKKNWFDINSVLIKPIS